MTYHFFSKIFRRLRHIPYKLFYLLCFYFVFISLKFKRSILCRFFPNVNFKNSSICFVYDLSFFPLTWDFPDYLAIAEAFAASLDTSLASVYVVYDSSVFKLPTFADYNYLAPLTII